MAKISINGTTLEYVDRGNGTPLVFIHGSVSDHRTWNPQVEYFSKRYRVIAYSRRYHYPNPWTGDGSDYGIDLHSKDLSSLLTELHLGPAHVIGSSYGAYTALITAMHHRNLVRTLVLGEPPVLPLLVENLDSPLDILRLAVRSPRTALHFMKFGLSAMKPAQNALRHDDLEQGVRLFANGVLGKGGFEKLPQAAQASMMDNAQTLKVELLGRGFDRFPIELARQCEIPTLLVYGSLSPGFFGAISDLLLQMLPQAQKIIIPNASHSMHRDNPDDYNQRVLAFLAKHK